MRLALAGAERPARGASVRREAVQHDDAEKTQRVCKGMVSVWPRWKA